MQPSLQACLLHARSNARDAGRRRGGREGGREAAQPRRLRLPRTSYCIYLRGTMG